ncbi:toxin C-terminal domain-containing protein [Psychrobacillus sp. FSL H8-0484]
MGSGDGTRPHKGGWKMAKSPEGNNSSKSTRMGTYVKN